MKAMSRLAVVTFFCLLAARLHGAGNQINVGMVPDAGATQVSVQEKAPLKTYLAHALGRDVNLIVPTNYNATIEALGNGSLDFAYLGGLSYLKAHKEYGVIPLVQRSVDLEFHTLFICGASQPIHSLQDLKNKKFAYGDINSTAGHLIPYMEMRQAGVNPDSQVQSRYSGSHPATAKAVESGAVDAGALDETVFNSMVSAGKLDANKVRVFHVSKPFVDYVWVARKDVDKETQDKFMQAFISLKEGQNDDVLQILRGKKFVQANNSEYNVLRLIAEELKMM